MALGSLTSDLRQFFSYSVLAKLERLDEADVRFTFEPESLYLSCYAEAMQLVEPQEFREVNAELLRYAQVFERFAVLRIPGVSRRSSLRTAATLYWLAGYSANATVLARALGEKGVNAATLRGALTLLLARSSQFLTAFTTTDGKHAADDGVAVLRAVAGYLVSGEIPELRRAERIRERLTSRAEARGDAKEYVAGRLLAAVMRRLEVTSLWGSIAERASAPQKAWQQFALAQVGLRAPLIDLWPSQRTAIRRGLLDGRSSLVLRMPTSAGKTKMTELAFVNDLFTDERRCLYLAPFRALVSEIEFSLGPSLADLGIGVASLYGGAETNELEVELSEKARVVIGTPEKMAAVLRMSGGHLTDFGTIVLDEGHLVGNRSRGASYELQLAALRSQIIERSSGSESAPRIIFLSAVLPNAKTIAAWLGGSEGTLADDSWHPTSLRVGVLTWPKEGAARIRYAPQPGQQEEVSFFVPRVLEQFEWTERDPQTKHYRRHRFPDPKAKGDIAAALAFRYAAHGTVIIYTQQPRWADSVARRILDRIALKQPIETNLVTETNRQALSELANYVATRLGEDSLVAQALLVGVGIHHGGVPITIRLAIEDAFRSQVLRLLVATSTVSQGVNFPVKTVILHSFPSGDAPVREFWNLAGRAGRAMRETDGEVLLLQTGDTKPLTVRRFLDRSQVEPAVSQILEFVREIYARYPVVQADSVQAVLAEDARSAEPMWPSVIAAIDTQLLEMMVEDLSAFETQAIDGIVENLLARRQIASGTTGQKELQGISALFEIRRQRLRALVPEVEDRRRYSRTGLSAQGAIALDRQLQEVRELFAEHPQLSKAAIERLLTILCAAPELKGEPAALATAVAWAWMQTGTYSEARAAGGGAFPNTDSAVQFVEQTVAYTLPWVMNGLLRLMEANGDIADDAISNPELPVAVPVWAQYLPQFLRFGVDDPELVWIMSLGIPDPGFAIWIRGQFEQARGRRPASFREIVMWMLDQQDELLKRASHWPRYFVRLLGEVLGRYSEVSKVLGA